MAISLLLEQEGEPALDAAVVQALIVAVLVHESVDGVVDGGIQWVDAERSAALNVEHRGVEGATDVISFPIDELDELPPGMPRQLGDLAICVDVVRGQLAEDTTMAGDTELDAALRRCVVHGTLHLLAADHDDDAAAQAMFAAEQRILESVAAAG